ncbi:conserved hypothetical protein [Planktothrix sp. PCC 11201]|uniref:hypothetical protein n=1 Tax=Planktothrix sp. PCC 11201 TaxID=1729650 RepID=UPI00091FE3B0|nr:hypothetical protein [Planktothrix sp. PCC 11201]SKB14266.1 conserved hypothetical protein [Planktothrix sp. PCC 11201]
MVIIVIVINIFISLLCLSLARKIWMLTLTINRLEKRLILMEQRTRFVLEKAPNFINSGQRGSYQLRQNYHQFQVKLQQLQQALGLISLAVKFWPKGGKPRKSNL